MSEAASGFHYWDRTRRPQCHNTTARLSYDRNTFFDLVPMSVSPNVHEMQQHVSSEHHTKQMICGNVQSIGDGTAHRQRTRFLAHRMACKLLGRMVRHPQMC